MKKINSFITTSFLLANILNYTPVYADGISTIKKYTPEINKSSEFKILNPFDEETKKIVKQNMNKTYEEIDRTHTTDSCDKNGKAPKRMTWPFFQITW